jgi:hypothetical protein
MGEPTKKDKCPLCNRTVSVVLLDSHVNSHLDAEELAKDRALAQKIATAVSPEKPERGKREKYAVTCDRGCNQEVPIQEWESHCLQHRLALGESAGHDARAFFDKGGFSKRPRGVSYGEGEWGKMSKMLRSRPVEENVRSLMSCQTKETTTTPVREGLMHLLQRCMESDQRAGFSTIALSGWVEHYESRHREDLGWGCGWRNIQMLASHLLMTDQDAREVLFGGCGFVPDILSLQRWVEVAWRKGFDTPGADYFNWEIVGTHKWIGTTECAALLRSFGMRARIVDFQSFGAGRVESSRGEEQDQNAQPTRSSLTSWTKPDPGSCSESQSRSGSRSRSTSRSGSMSRHASPVGGEDCECSGCGEYPIQGVRYRHSEIRNADLCVACMEKMRNSANKHERDVAEGYEGVDFDPGSCSRNPADSLETSRHQHIVEWVWNYFMERSNRTTSSAATAFDRLRQPIVLSKRSPLYFQHRGHSRTIVGIEKRRRPGSSEEVFLIVLDPSQKTGDIVKTLREKSGWQRLLKRGLQTLKHAEYQLCYVDPGLATGDEYEKLKILSSVHYTY